MRLLLQAGGPAVVAEVAHRLGIPGPLPDNATLALGTGEVGLLDMAAAYATFFNGGIAHYADRPGGHHRRRARRFRCRAAAASAVLDPDVAAMMARMMAAVVSRGSGRAAALPGRTVAGKTGTTQDYHDAWFIGWTGGTSSACGWAMTTTRRCAASPAAACRPGCFTTSARR